MDPTEHNSREYNYLCSKSTEIATAVAKLHPSGSVPSIGPPFARDRNDYNNRFKHTFPLTFQDGTEWLITFPYTAGPINYTVRRRIESEVATLKWLKRNTTLPVPTVHAWEPKGKSGGWNGAARPCIVLDRMPGKIITNEDWQKLTKEQQTKIYDQLARIKGELLTHHFDKIGSIWPDRKTEFKVGTLITHQVNRYCYLHGADPRLLKLFKTEKAPYDTAMEYFVDMANMRLIHEAIGSKVMDDQYVEWWIYRSMLPSLVYDKANRGPFVLGHGMLNRNAVLFDDELNLSGVINWEYSMVEPLQLCCAYPPWTYDLPLTDNESLKLRHEIYFNSLRKYEQEFRQKKEEKEKNEQIEQTEQKKQIEQKNLDILPLLDYILNHGATLHHVALYSGLPLLNSTAGLWEGVFQPNFGAIDKASFIKIYSNAPGLLEEFKRMRLFLETNTPTLKPPPPSKFLAEPISPRQPQHPRR